MVHNRIVNLETNQSCPAPTDFEFAGFLADDRIVFVKPSLHLRNYPVQDGEIQVRHPDCSVENAWQMAEGRVWGTCRKPES